MDLLTQLNRAMTYVEENIRDDIALANISTVTAYSAYHFGRLFYYITGMPLSEYVRKRKLSLAGDDLQNSDTKIIDVAVKYGYDSADSFTRAFVRQHGVTPSAARKSGTMLKIFSPLAFQIKIKGVQEMNWRIEQEEAFEVFGIERVFSNDEMDKVPGFWDELKQNGTFEKLVADALGAPVGAICGYSECGSTFPYMICAPVTKGCKTEGYKVFKVPKSTFAAFKSEPLSDWGEAIPELFGKAAEWLQTSHYDRAKSPDMEVYLISPTGKKFEEVWIPVVKK